MTDEPIDLSVEALTGTVYDLCVSPFETILGIKMKIQRLEGFCSHECPVPANPLWSLRHSGIPAAASLQRYGASGRVLPGGIRNLLGGATEIVDRHAWRARART